MSWIDRLDNTVLEIETGDGQKYRPLWINAIKNVNFNTEGFDFVGVDGSFVSRKEQSGDQFPITLYFQGEDCIDEADAFQISSKDQRPWKIKHPFFDNILVQPLNLQFDYSNYNVVKITGVLWRTITAKFPEDTVDQSDRVVSRKSTLDAAFAPYSVVAIPQPATTLLTPLGKAVDGIEKAFETLANSAQSAKALKDKARAASGAVQNIFNDLTSFTNSLVDLINFPFTLASNIEFSINSFFDAFNRLVIIFDPNDEQQKIFAEISLTALNSAAAAQFVNPSEDDFQTRDQVAQATDALTALSDGLTAYYDLNGYAQDPQLAFDLSAIINVAQASLFDIAFQSKQERSVIIGKDSDPINLAHKYFGPGDEALNSFIRTNNITREEIFEIKKGREIIYLV